MRPQTQSTFIIKDRKYRLAFLLLFSIVSCTSKQQFPSDGQSHVPSSQSNYRCLNVSSYQGEIVGDGHCVSLIKRCSGAPHTSYWKPGKRVMQSSQLAPGTIIATFKNNRYPNTEGHHAAIYISHDEKGIWVWDQWQGKAVHKRLIRTRSDRAPASNRARAYRVVKFN